MSYLNLVLLLLFPILYGCDKVDDSLSPGKASNPGNPNFALSGFDNDLWQKINAVINQ